MSKSVRFEEQLVIRVAKPLREELEAAAMADGRPLSNQIRKVLTEFATARVLSRTSADVGAR